LCTAIIFPQSSIFAEEANVSVDVHSSTEVRGTGIREGSQTIDAGSLPEKPSSQSPNITPGDIDGDGYEDAATIEPDFSDSDSDSDVVADEVKKEVEIVEYRNGDSKESNVRLTTDTPKLLQALSIEATSPLLFDGVEVNVISETCDEEKGGDCVDGDDDIGSSSANIAFHISGADIRSWDTEQKEILKTSASEVQSIETPNDFGLWLATKILENESITELSTLQDYVEIKYSTTARLLGFIPITMPATARKGGRMKVGDVTLKKVNVTEVDFPWYGFLVPKKSLLVQMESDVKVVFDNYQTSHKQQVKFKAGKALADTVK